MKIFICLTCIVLLTSCSISQSNSTGVSSEDAFDTSSDVGLIDASDYFGEDGGIYEYRMQLNEEGQLVFVDIELAFNYFCVDFADEIQEVKKEFDLKAISAEYWMPYRNLGWQLNGNNPLQKRASDISLFLEYYEHSFNITSPDDFS